MQQYDVIVIGGGLAGLTAAIDLSQKGHSVLVLEKNTYPHHKVCGEYLSNEVKPYLKRLGVVLNAANTVDITHFQLSTGQGKSMECELPLGGMGVSRFALDYELYRRAISLGANFRFEIVNSIRFYNTSFEVVTDTRSTYTSTIVIGAYGKRSGLDKVLKRDFITKNSSWLAVKAHYYYEDFPQHRVALHNFEGGYAGLSRTETGAINFCYLTSYASFRKEKDIDSFNARVVSKNPFLKTFLHTANPLFNAPLTIAQVSFHPKKVIENHILMCGDTAGLIHPLCGNGMAMAIHSAKIASTLVDDFLKSDKPERIALEKAYQWQWNAQFKRRLWMGRRLQSLLLQPGLSAMALSALVLQPNLVQKLIRSTHGNPIV